MKFMLFDKTANIYAGLNGIRVVAVDSKNDAVQFDMKMDNPNIKRNFYNSVTGANFEIVTI